VGPYEGVCISSVDIGSLMLWQSGARRQGGTGGVGTGVKANCANHGD